MNNGGMKNNKYSLQYEEYLFKVLDNFTSFSHTIVRVQISSYD